MAEEPTAEHGPLPVGTPEAQTPDQAEAAAVSEHPSPPSAAGGGARTAKQGVSVLVHTINVHARMHARTFARTCVRLHAHMHQHVHINMHVDTCSHAFWHGTPTRTHAYTQGGRVSDEKPRWHEIDTETSPSPRHTPVSYAHNKLATVHACTHA